MALTPFEKSQQQQDAKAKFRKFVIYYALVSVPICLVIMFWPMADNVTVHGKLAHYLAIPLAFILGLVFMSILFFSSNSGGDEQPNYVEMAERQERRKTEAAREKLKETPSDPSQPDI